MFSSEKQRISLSTNFPARVNEGKLVDKETRCPPLISRSISYAWGKFRSDKGKMSLLHE